MTHVQSARSAIAIDEVAPPRRDRRLEAWVAGSAAVHAAFLGIALLAPPESAALTLDGSDALPRYVHVALTPAATEPYVEVPRDEARGEPTGAGAPETSPSPRAYRARRHGEPRRSTVRHEDPLALLGTLGRALTTRSSAGASPFDAARLDGDQSALAMLAADRLGVGGGLDMLGTGRGTGGGTGATIGWGTGGTGFGATCGSDEPDHWVRVDGRLVREATCGAGTLGNGIGTGAMMQRRPPEVALLGRCGSAPCVVPGPIATRALESNGSLSRDAVRRVVVRGRPMIRGCYEHALVTRPELSGRISLTWMVSPSGAVSASAVDARGSDLHAPELEQCMLHAVRSWTFPESHGPTGVTFPFLLDTE
jgi:hypothetical protein